MKDDKGNESEALVFTIKKNHLLKSCQSIVDTGLSNGDGIYTIDPDGAGTNSPFDVYCDMTNQGGGWTLVAHHKDGLNVIVKDKVDLNTFGILNSNSWQQIRKNMNIGMMFIDENKKISSISSQKLKSGNCFSIENSVNLHQSGLMTTIWHDEKAGCSLTGTDYSFIRLDDTSDYANAVIAGAAVYQQSNIKFDLWPYQNSSFSYSEQNELYYFIK